ncbi:hypothetical protein C7378_2628 [Acidipila rosea]|uniref:Uncharacterized protein n=2 Tax=Acidipila rosea TaxID=768535 RepID=A0A4R1L4G5_9BACT|nr:hypothetical protein C7378_2628 [Acidipila rosea]
MIAIAPLRLNAQEGLPDAPLPQWEMHETIVAMTPFDGGGQMSFPATPHQRTATVPSAPPHCQPYQSADAETRMCCQSDLHPFATFLQSQRSAPPTAREKFELAGRDTIDPFNLLTIVGTSAITAASNPHSVYGPGFEGWGKLSGVAFTQNATGEFFGTALIPSLMHQDPHYHRMPNASYRRRFFHAITQIAWTQGDHGAPMFNYATIVGSIAEEAVSDAYVPYRENGWSASGTRIGLALATDPIGNLITEFLPDLASHINFRVVFVQRIVNEITIQEGGAPSE